MFSGRAHAFATCVKKNSHQMRHVLFALSVLVMWSLRCTSRTCACAMCTRIVQRVWKTNARFWANPKLHGLKEASVETPQAM